MRGQPGAPGEALVKVNLRATGGADRVVDIVTRVSAVELDGDLNEEAIETGLHGIAYSNATMIMCGGGGQAWSLIVAPAGERKEETP